MKRFSFLHAFGLVLALFTPVAALAAPCSLDYRVPLVEQIAPAHPCAGDSLRLIVRSCRECVDIVALERTASGGIRVLTRSPEVCPRIPCLPDSASLELGQFAAGHFQMIIEVSSLIVASIDSCTIIRDDTLAFSVARDCPPPPSTLPYVNAICIGAPDRCDSATRVACPNTPTPVFLSGELPNDCFSIRRVEVLEAGDAIYPYIHIVVDDGACLGRACIQIPVPWARSVELPAVGPGPRIARIVLDHVSCADSSAPGQRFTALIPFQVAEQCSIPPFNCLLEDWKHPDGRGTGCDAFLTPEQAARATLLIRSSTPLAGLEGTLRLNPDVLHIVNLEPVGPAAGMHLRWTPTSDGAHFVMFAESGAPIPATLRDSSSAGVPVLAVDVARGLTDPVAPRVTLLGAPDLLGSDSTGGGVPRCPTAAVFFPVARICSGGGCDVNGDGVADIRDLVIMVHCVLGTGACPDSLHGHLDCNGDGVEDLNDVLCCARVIIHGGGPDTTHARPEPGVSLHFGTPVRTATGYEVPLSLRGADRLGAARLALSYPADRFELDDVRFGGDPATWLELYEPGDREALLGLISLGSGGAGASEIPITLVLKLKPGQEASGEVAVSAADFSGPDGATLEVKLGETGTPIGAPSRLGLSAFRPNPFSGETRFSVSMPRAGDVELAVHDLSGRRVATLYRGRLAAGTREFVWDGRADGGAVVANGIYFVRLAAGGEIASRKIALLRGE